MLWILIPVLLLIAGPIEAARSGNIGLAWLQTAWNVLMAQVFAFGVITLTFMRLDRSTALNRAYTKSATTWDPGHLPALPATSRQAKSTPLSAAIVESISSVFFTGIWLAAFWGNGNVSHEFRRNHRCSLLDVLALASPRRLSCQYRRRLVLPRQASCRSNKRVASIQNRRGEFSASPCVSSPIAGSVLKSASLAPQALSSTIEWTNLGIRDSLGIAALVTGYTVADRILRLSRKTQTGQSSLAPTTTN